jgi:ATP-dependent protease ClpP protease subunit
LRIDVKGAIISNDEKWIYDLFEMDATCPRDINSAIEKANGEPLDIYINSGGGSIFAGAEIYESIRQYNGVVNIHVIWAASAASVIAEAGNSEISPVGMYMVHNVSGGANGDYNTMGATRDILLTANKAVSMAYQIKTGKSEKELLAMMDKSSDNLGTWLTAKEAVEQGFIDRISVAKSLPLVASCNSPMLSPTAIEKIRNTVKRPLGNDADIFMRQKAQAQLNLIKLGGLER